MTHELALANAKRRPAAPAERCEQPVCIVASEGDSVFHGERTSVRRRLCNGGYAGHRPATRSGQVRRVSATRHDRWQAARPCRGSHWPNGRNARCDSKRWRSSIRSSSSSIPTSSKPRPIPFMPKSGSSSSRRCRLPPSASCSKRTMVGRSIASIATTRRRTSGTDRRKRPATCGAASGDWPPSSRPRRRWIRSDRPSVCGPRLQRADGATSVADIVCARPDLRHIVTRVQSLAGLDYAELRANWLSEHFHALRCHPFRALVLRPGKIRGRVAEIGARHVHARRAHCTGRGERRRWRLAVSADANAGDARYAARTLRGIAAIAARDRDATRQFARK